MPLVQGYLLESLKGSICKIDAKPALPYNLHETTACENKLCDFHNLSVTFTLLLHKQTCVKGNEAHYSFSKIF